MNFISTPSLEHMTLVKIAVTLWSQKDIRRRVSKLPRVACKWQKIEKAVADKVAELSLPKLLKEKLMVIIGPVGLRILLWMERNTFYDFFTEMPAVLFLTAQGTIDGQRTLEVLVKDETRNIEQRFQLACMYCMESDIRDLWGKLCVRENSSQMIPLNNPFLASFWRDYLIEKDEANLQKKFVDHFETVVMSGNDIATRFFYLKMSSQNADMLRMTTAKRVASLLQFRPIHFRFEQCSDSLCFLMSTMNVEQQAEIFESYTYAVLKSLLVWPRQSLFLETAKNKWEFLSKQCYNDLLHDILDRMRCKTNYLSQLLGDFWRQTPENYKQFVTDRNGIGCLLLKLYHREDENNIKLILNDLSTSAKEKLIFSDVGLDICRYLVSGLKWDSVEYLIEECISSSEEIIKFKDKLKKYVTELYSILKFTEEYHWDTFFQLVEDCILGCSKRKHVEDTNTSSKRHCHVDTEE